MSITRRDFLAAGAGCSAIVASSAVVPQFLLRAAAGQKASAGENILVVVQLTGGNDGLNTVVPYADDLYQKNRFTLRQTPGAVHKIDDYLGFHPALDGFVELRDAGKLTVIQGVGYANPNRSHFESMDVWHTAARGADARQTGWLGRCCDAHGAQAADLPAVHLGSEQQPLALAGLSVHVPSVRSLDAFRLEDSGHHFLRDSIAAANAAPRAEASDLLKHIQATSRAALESSQRVAEVMGNYQSPISYPGTDLAKKLRGVAQLIDAGLGTRIYYVTLDGFDTHSEQGDTHAGLLRELGGAVAAFVSDLTEHGHDRRVLVMAFSEFGRRVKENASRGTDHGAAAPMFLAGGSVKGSVVGRHPSLTDLEDGDLKFHTDFRQVYATVLDRWLGWPSKDVLGKQYETVDVLG
jgi:uncharacterized protein (DUF1501 family)